MPHLSKCMLYVLSLYVFGTIVMKHCGQSRIAGLLSRLQKTSYGTMRQRLREFTYEAEGKRGEQRQEVDVQTCFAPLLKWVLAKFTGDQKQVVLALDATYLKDRFVILALSVVVAGCAIPVAWHIQEGNRKGAWNPIWFHLLDSLKDAVPDDWTVFALTDSGLYSKALFEHLRDMGWLNFMRINASQGLFLPKGAKAWIPISSLLHKGMSPCVMTGKCFKGDPITCSLVLQWGDEYETPCVLVSNVAADQVVHNVYTTRYWIECGFKDGKRGLLHWEQTKMKCPKRAERLWLVISIALLFLTCLGEAASDDPHWKDLQSPSTRHKLFSASLLGWIETLVALLEGYPLSSGYLKPYSWLPLPHE